MKRIDYFVFGSALTVVLAFGWFLLITTDAPHDLQKNLTWLVVFAVAFFIANEIRAD